MSGKRAAGLVLIVLGAAALLWGVNLNNSMGSQIAGAIGIHDDTGNIAMPAGALLALIGVALALQREAIATRPVAAVQAVSDGMQVTISAKIPPVVISPGLLASIRAKSQMVATNFPNDELLSGVLGHLKAGNKINAIKFLRQTTNCGLKDGKDLVDEVDRAQKKAAV